MCWYFLVDFYIIDLWQILPHHVLIVLCWIIYHWFHSVTQWMSFSSPRFCYSNIIIYNKLMIQYSIPTSKKSLLLFVCKTGTLANLWIYCCAPVRMSYCKPFSGRKRIKHFFTFCLFKQRIMNKTKQICCENPLKSLIYFWEMKQQIMSISCSTC